MRSHKKVIEKDKTSFSDPNFASNKARAIHRWVPWIAGFSSDFVKSVLDDHLQQRGVVLDPFAGVGTTLVEAASAGHDVVGFEINPYATLACRVKLNAGAIDLDSLKSTVKQLGSFYNRKSTNGYNPKSQAPEGFKTREAFYSPAVLRKVLIIQDFVRRIEHPKIADVLQLAFAATMVGYSNYSYEPSLGTRKAVGKNHIDDFDVIKSFLKKLDEIISDIEAIQPNLSSMQVKVVNDSFFQCRNYIGNQSVNLCITSPPYLNNYHYIRNTRPQLYWLGFVQKSRDTKTLEQNNFGKYWQTVRELENIGLDFPNPPTALVEQLNHLRTLKSERGIYGGNGWANYAASYFNDCYRFAMCLKKVLKTDGQAFVVIGNSILQGEMIPTDKYFGTIAANSGLELVDINVPRPTRVGNSIIQSDIRVEKAQDSHTLYESVVHLKKTKHHQSS